MPTSKQIRHYPVTILRQGFSFRVTGDIIWYAQAHPYVDNLHVDFKGPTGEWTRANADEEAFIWNYILDASEIEDDLIQDWKFGLTQDEIILQGDKPCESK